MKLSESFCLHLISFHFYIITTDKSGLISAVAITFPPHPLRLGPLSPDLSSPIGASTHSSAPLTRTFSWVFSTSITMSTVGLGHTKEATALPKAHKSRPSCKYKFREQPVSISILREPLFLLAAPATKPLGLYEISRELAILKMYPVMQLFG